MRIILLIMLLLAAGMARAGQEDNILQIPREALSWKSPPMHADSLKLLLKEAKDRLRTDILCELANQLLRSRQEASTYLPLLEEAYKLAIELNYPEALPRIWLLQSIHQRHQNRTSVKVHETLRQAEINLDETSHWSLKHRIWWETSRYYASTGNPNYARAYIMKSLFHLPYNTAWLAHLEAHIWLMRHYIIYPDPTQQQHHLEQALAIIGLHMQHLHLNGFGLIQKTEEIVISLAYNGNYRRATEILHTLHTAITEASPQNFYTEFYLAKIQGRLARIYTHWGYHTKAQNWFTLSIEQFAYVHQKYYAPHPAIPPAASYRIWAINAANQLEERADLFIRMGDLRQAEHDLTESLSVRKEYNDTLGIAMCREKIGEIYALRGQFSQALHWYQTALELKTDVLEKQIRTSGSTNPMKVLFSREGIASNLLKTGNLFLQWEQYAQAKQYYEKSLVLSRENEMLRCHADALRAMGSLFLTLQLPDSILHYYRLAAQIYENIGYEPGNAMLSESIGDLFAHKHLTTEAQYHYLRAKQLYTQLEMPIQKANLLLKLSGQYRVANQNNKAIETLEEIVDIAYGQQLQNLLLQAHLGLYELFANQANHQKALMHFVLYDQIRDELYNLETRQIIAEMETRFQTQQAKQEILLLQTEKELYLDQQVRNRALIFGLALFVLLLLLWILLYIRHYSLKNGHEKIVLEQKLLRSQMNPHFIFNSLGCIQNAILSQQPERAAKYLSRFAKLIRSILDSSQAEQISLAQELATLENYLELQKARFPKKFDYLMEGTGQLETEDLFIPPMLLQPFIENAIEHGIRHMDTKGLIRVRFELTGDLLTIAVEDNGIGREKARILNTSRIRNHKSRATDITRERINAHNRKARQEIRFNITDLCDAEGKATGTRVVFDIPV